ncbi:MAG: cation transporter [Clostridia bacterium]|nr:cation transporter [Clostridia bacterium]
MNLLSVGAFYFFNRGVILKSLKFHFQSAGKKITYINVILNLLLAIFKFFVGVIAHSSALISDSVNSISDVLGAGIVIIGLHLSSKKADKDHPYGHERFECVAAIILAVFILVTGLFMGYIAIGKISSGESSEQTIPGALAIVIAIVSMAVKEGMYWYTRHYAKLLDSSSLMGIAWDNRSDVFATLCVLIGIVGSRLGVPILDSIASLIVSIFIIKASINIFIDAIGKMVDTACPEDIQTQIKELAEKQEGICGIDLIQTRVFGNRIYVDIEISVLSTISVVEGHEIAEKLHDTIEETIDNVKHIMVHINPYKNEG